MKRLTELSYFQTIRVVPFRTDFELPIFNWTEFSGEDCKSAYKREQDSLEAHAKQVEEV